MSPTEIPDARAVIKDLAIDAVHCVSETVRKKVGGLKGMMMPKVQPAIENQAETPEPSVEITKDRERMRVLLIEPKSPPSYWSHSYTMQHIGKKAAIEPLGLVTLAGMLPSEWDLDLADLNVGDLEDERMRSADAVFIGGMHIQAPSFHEQVMRAKAMGKKVVGGGPYVTTSPEECGELDHLVIGEAEGGIHEWLQAFRNNEAGKITRMPDFPSLEGMPVPRHDLIDPKNYFSMGLQLSRGCPHDCEFCSVTALNGRRPRLKTEEQFLAEAEAIRRTGFRGSTFVVDDNFIGNKRVVGEMLPKIAEWQKANGYPLDFYTQADLRLAKYEEFMRQMVDAGFSGAFLGIETPSKEALVETGKHQNASIDLDEAVDKIARAGIEPMAGFIMGFDSDRRPEDIDELIAFINRNPIPKAMVGVLQAAPKTKLFERMREEGRLRTQFNGDQFGRANFETVMDATVLREKYGQVLKEIYAPENYFARCLQLMSIRKEEKDHSSFLRDRPLLALTALKNSVWHQGVLSEYRGEYWKFIARVTATMPDKFATGISHALKFDHLYRYTNEDVLPNLG